MIRVLLLSALTILLSLNTQAQTVDTNFVDGVVYLKVLDASSVDPTSGTVTALIPIIATYGIDSIIQPFPGLNTTLDKTYRVHFRNIGLINNLIAALAALPFVEFAEKAPLYRTGYVAPNDMDAQQNYLNKIYAEAAWDISTGSQSIVVAIVDNAVRTDHEDLVSSMWQNPSPNSGLLDMYPNDVLGWDVSDNDNDPSPPAITSGKETFFHGTHCAGIAGATTNNGKGVASIGYGVRIMGVKCAPNSGSGNTLPDNYDGVYYAIQANADVISMSFGGSSGNFETGQNLMNAAYVKGIVLVASAGNNGAEQIYYPAAYDHVIAVGSTDSDDGKSSFSNYGSHLDVMAPGRSIYSLKAETSSSYGNASGTSMSAPLVAGLCALMLSNDPSLTPDQLETQLKNSCDDISSDNPGLSGKIGAGRINAVVALGGSTPTVGINDVDPERQMLFSFNRYTKSLVLSGPMNTNDELELVDMSGRVVYRKTITTTAAQIRITDLPELNSGIYIVTLYGSAGKFQSKISY